MRARFEQETAADRFKEQGRRNALARSRALSTLARRYSDEYQTLYEEEVDRAYFEAGPLPGDY